jgi:hypothetical protein
LAVVLLIGSVDVFADFTACRAAAAGWLEIRRIRGRLL